MRYVVVPSGVSALACTHQEHHLWRRALHADNAKLPHSLADFATVLGTGAVVRLRVSRFSPNPGVQPLMAQTWEAHPFVVLRTIPQNNCATCFPTHPGVFAFTQTHSPTDVSTAHAFLSRILSSNDRTDIQVYRAHHTEDKGEGTPAGSDRTT